MAKDEKDNLPETPGSKVSRAQQLRTLGQEQVRGRGLGEGSESAE